MSEAQALIDSASQALDVGAAMSNVCFNLAQRDSLPAHERKTLDDLRLQWDSVSRAAREALAAWNRAVPADVGAIAAEAKRIAHEYAYMRATDTECFDAIDAIASRASGAVPAGWKLVPVEPTEAMLEAGRDVKRRRLLSALDAIKRGADPDMPGKTMAVHEEWAAMLAASPTTPTQEGAPLAGEQKP